MYDSARFFALTGRRLKGTPATVNKRQKALDRLHATLFPPKQAKPAAAKSPTPTPVPSANGRQEPVRGDLNLFLAKLQAVKATGNGQYTALCPAHPDHKPSLSVGLGRDGRILLHCFSTGCSAEAIVRSLG